MKCPQCNIEITGTKGACEKCGYEFSVQSYGASKLPLGQSDNPEEIYKQILLTSYTDGRICFSKRIELFRLQKSLNLNLSKAFELEKWSRTEIQMLLEAEKAVVEKAAAEKAAAEKAAAEKAAAEKAAVEKATAERETAEKKMKKNAVERKNCFLQFIGSIHDRQIFSAPNIDSKKLHNAITTYAPEVKPEDVLILVDDTVFGSAKKGCIITKDSIFVKDPVISAKKFSIKASSVFEYKNGKITNKVLMDGEILFAFNQPDALGLRKVANALQMLVTIKNSQKLWGIPETFFEDLIPPNDEGNASGKELEQKTFSYSQKTKIDHSEDLLSNTDVSERKSKSRNVYILLSIFLPGIHSFYIGQILKGILQIFFIAITAGPGLVIVWPWAVIESHLIKCDSRKILLKKGSFLKRTFMEIIIVFIILAIISFFNNNKIKSDKKMQNIKNAEKVNTYRIFKSIIPYGRDGQKIMD